MSSDLKVAEKIGLCIIATIGFIGAVAGIGLLLAWPIKWTWNAIMPYLFGWPVLTWGKAWCLNFLTGCLVKSRFSATKS